MPLASGATFAGYTNLRLIGRGGMSEVYLAQHPRLPRRDALKILPEATTADSAFRLRFHREAELATLPVAPSTSAAAPHLAGPVLDGTYPALFVAPPAPAADGAH